MRVLNFFVIKSLDESMNEEENQRSAFFLVGSSVFRRACLTDSRFGNDALIIANYRRRLSSSASVEGSHQFRRYTNCGYYMYTLVEASARLEAPAYLT